MSAIGKSNMKPSCTHAGSCGHVAPKDLFCQPIKLSVSYKGPNFTAAPLPTFKMDGIFASALNPKK